MTELLGKNQDELKELVLNESLPAFTARQLSEWIYKKRVRSFHDMTNLSKKARNLLSEKYETGFRDYKTVRVSSDGTKKYLFPVRNGHFVEAAYIPDKERATLCVSSQVGCKMNCEFCQTGKQGFQQNLSAGEILNQILNLPEFETLTNVVYMGMGEPFDNTEEVLKSTHVLTGDFGLAWSPSRITVSTIGILPGMKKFLDESRCHLAVSLHSPFEEEREKLMPVNKKYPIKSILEVLKEYDFSKQRRVSFEYILFKDINDSAGHSKKLARLLGDISCRVNLIPFHQIPGINLEPAEEVKILKFQETLKNQGITTTIRKSRGQDIEAACGLLSTKQHQDEHYT